MPRSIVALSLFVGALAQLPLVRRAPRSFCCYLRPAHRLARCARHMRRDVKLYPIQGRGAQRARMCAC
eukprot:1254798-Prymnesium_polylepis.1